MDKKVLMIAFHIPPADLGSGHLRTLGFARHLPALGWQPIILSASAGAFPRTDASNNALIPDDCIVHRAFALDARRHFGIGGKYFAILAQPDRWMSWWPAAVLQGLRLIRRHQISVIWSTYPIMTAHCIAHTLHRLTRLPWVADFRDPVPSSIESGNKFSFFSQKRCERKMLNRASHAVFTTPGAMEDYAKYYIRHSKARRLRVIPNGYEEAFFSRLVRTKRPQPTQPLTLLHSGLLYRDSRNPLPFFRAVANLKTKGLVNVDTLRIVLRASGSRAIYAEELKKLAIDGIIILAPRVSNRQALQEQADADALLLFQGDKYDRQIPAKVYEYLRVGHPIFALVGEHGETASLLDKTGGARLAPLSDISIIEQRLIEFIQALREQNAPRVDLSEIAKYSRAYGAATLTSLFDEIVT